MEQRDLPSFSAEQRDRQLSAGILKISAGLCRMALLVAVASPSYAVVEELDGQRAQQATYVTIAATTPANLPVDAADMVDVGSLAVSITRTTPAPVMVKVSVSLSNANNTPGQARTDRPFERAELSRAAVSRRTRSPGWRRRIMPHTGEETSRAGLGPGS